MINNERKNFFLYQTLIKGKKEKKGKISMEKYEANNFLVFKEVRCRESPGPGL